MGARERGGDGALALPGWLVASAVAVDVRRRGPLACDVVRWSVLRASILWVWPAWRWRLRAARVQRLAALWRLAVLLLRLPAWWLLRRIAPVRAVRRPLWR